MRIVGGILSGRRFAGPSWRGTRPTAERVREAIASAIESRGGFTGTWVLDLYAGTGAMAFEALSRGATAAVLVEWDRTAARGIERSARALGLAERCTTIVADVRTPAAMARIAEASGAPFDRVFVDPPYADVEHVVPLIGRLRARGLLAAGCLVAIEHGRHHALPPPDGFDRLGEKRYGDTSVTLLRGGSTVLPESPP